MQLNYNGNSLKSGIYKITNTITNKVYIGSAKRFKERWLKHSQDLKTGKHHNKHLLHSFQQYGDAAFIFDVVEVMNGSTKAERLVKEEFYIQALMNDGIELFNHHLFPTQEAKETCFSKTPEQTKAKIVAAQKKLWQDEQYKAEMLDKMQQGKREALQDPEYREQLSQNIKKGQDKQAIAETSKERWSNPEYKQKVSQSMKEYYSNNPEYIESRKETFNKRKADKQGWEQYQAKVKAHAKRLWKEGILNHEVSEETRLKQSIAAKNRIKQGKDPLTEYKFKSVPQTIIDPSGNLITIENMKQYCLEHGLDYQKFRKLPIGECKSYNGYTSPTYEQRKQAKKEKRGKTINQNMNILVDLLKAI